MQCYCDGFNPLLPAACLCFQTGDCRYLLCPAAMNIGHLKKFVRFKFDLKADLQVITLTLPDGIKMGCEKILSLHLPSSFPFNE